jgi:hypothetical protein
MRFLTNLSKNQTRHSIKVIVNLPSEGENIGV